MSMSQDVDKIPNGPGAAAILAAGIGCGALGILTLASELSDAVGKQLNFYGPVGPLSGKTTIPIIIWLITWFVLSRLWQSKTVNLATVNVLAFVLLGIGFLFTFPPFWALF